MRITPHWGYSKYRVPLFIIHSSDRALTMRGPFGDFTVKHLDELRFPSSSERAIYSCVDPDELCLYGDPRAWVIRSWNGRISSMEYGGVKVYPLLSSWDDTIEGFFTYLDDMGVAASSLNTMSLNLWRTTLDADTYFHEEAPYDEMLGPVAMRTGGRKEAKRGRYRKRVEYDITSAYPNALDAGPIPSRLVPVSNAFIKAMDIDKWEGIAVARVRIPPLEWGPLPVLLDDESEISCYGYTKATEWATVVVPLSELRMAASTVGVDYRIVRCHIVADASRPFAEWLGSIVPALRGLHGLSGTLGKLVANRLWSCFAVSPHGDRREHRFDGDGNMSTVVLPADPTAQTLRRASTCYVGAFVASRVRQRLYNEGIRSIPGVVYVDTDGVIGKQTSDIPQGWRIKTVMPYVEVAGPQAVYYTCPDCLPASVGKGHDKGHWTVAGAQSVEAKSKLFRLMAGGGMLMANIGNVIPSQDVNEYGETQTSEQATVTPSLLSDDS